MSYVYNKPEGDAKFPYRSSKRSVNTTVVIVGGLTHYIELRGPGTLSAHCATIKNPSSIPRTNQLKWQVSGRDCHKKIRWRSDRGRHWTADINLQPPVTFTGDCAYAPSHTLGRRSENFKHTEMWRRNSPAWWHKSAVPFLGSKAAVSLMLAWTIEWNLAWKTWKGKLKRIGAGGTVKMFEAKHGEMSLIPGTHMVEGRTGS